MLIVLGASGGIGGGILHHVAETGQGRDFMGVTAAYRKDCDLTSETSVAAFFDGLAQSLPTRSPWQLINATGNLMNCRLKNLDLDVFRAMTRVHLDGSVLVLKHFQRTAPPGSSALLLSSIVAQTGVVGAAHYGALKGAIEGLVRGAAKEFASTKHRVNAVRLGYFDSGMIAQVPAELLATIREAIPVQRLGSIGELFTVCSGVLLSSYMTGAVVDVNGGLP